VDGFFLAHELEALDFKNQFRPDPLLLLSLVGGSAVYWDLPLKTSKVSFDSLSVQNGGVYFFFLKASGGASDMVKGSINNLEDFKKMASETTGFLRALQLISTSTDQGA
jgi:hypothetical protein